MRFVLVQKNIRSDKNIKRGREQKNFRVQLKRWAFFMKKEVIKDKNKILVFILKSNDFAKGLNFYTEDKDFIQVATWNYDKGKKTIPHTHKSAKRIANKTQECIYLKKGKAILNIYNEKEKIIKKIILKSGDIAIILNGGHSLEVLDNKTQVLEVKNGPYLGREKDKKIINV